MDVQHDAEQQRFVLELEVDEAVLEYQWLSDNSVNFSRTYVPFHARGKGYAEELVRVGLGWAKQQQLSVAASCWYVKQHLES